MSYSDEEDLPFVLQHVKRQQRAGRAPKLISQPIHRLLTRYGFANVQERAAWDRALQQAAGVALARHCRAGQYRGGVLEIVVGNSTTLQELTFQKRRLVKKLNELLPGFNVRDIRFRIGEIA